MNETSEQVDNLVREVRQAAEEKIQNILKHYEAGKRDCENGIYDKWYRYNTWQDGRAYDLGWMEQNETVKSHWIVGHWVSLGWRRERPQEWHGCCGRKKE